MHTVIFSPLQFLCILLLEDMFVQVQALQQRVPGPSLSHFLARNVKGTDLLLVFALHGFSAEDFKDLRSVCSAFSKTMLAVCIF